MQSAIECFRVVWDEWGWIGIQNIRITVLPCGNLTPFPCTPSCNPSASPLQSYFRKQLNCAIITTLLCNQKTQSWIIKRGFVCSSCNREWVVWLYCRHKVSSVSAVNLISYSFLLSSIPQSISWLGDGVGEDNKAIVLNKGFLLARESIDCTEWTMW